MSIDKNIQILNEGRMAAIALQHIGTLIHEMKIKKMHELSMNYRSGKIDQATLACIAAGFCALEDLESEMKRKILKGEKASNEMNKEQTK